MFFSPDLLSRRDSGFGLLWLAATLGAKSSFKKLPRRSVLTADISQLCDLISEPEEPLALRLSSNLMVGVVRVYKVKQEIFLADVTTCFNSLKKAITEINMASTAQLQMGQPSVRPETLNLDIDPANALAVGFANMFMDWEETTAVGFDKGGGDDEEFDPTDKTKKAKQKKKQKVTVPSSENLRANPHTLNEDLSHLLSFEASFSQDNFGGAGDPFSSQGGDAFGFEDSFLGDGQGLDLTLDIGDELARELGEGWGANDMLNGMDVYQPMQFGGDDFGTDFDMGGYAAPIPDPQESDDGSRGSKKRPLLDSDKENQIPQDSFRQTNPMLQSRQVSSAPPEPEVGNAPAKRPRKRGKAGALIIDEVTELTAEELKDARAQYMERQNLIREELDAKKRERESILLIEHMLWEVPHDILAPEIIDFWRDRLRAQIAGRIVIVQDEPPKKRHKTNPGNAIIPEAEGEPFEMGDDYERDVDVNMDFGNDFGNNDNPGMIRSSEEPGQGRNASRPLSVIGSQLGLRVRGVEESAPESQKSALFPWDNAGASSSSGPGFEFADATPVGSANIRLRRRSSRTQSPSQRERGSSILKSLADSPAQFGGRNSRLSVDDFEFQVPGEESLVETQPENSLLTLEKNSFNFLEYAKMQFQTLPAANALSFKDIVPTETSTRHVAAAGFYHCLVLGTKHLVGLRQDEPYGNIEISIK